MTTIVLGIGNNVPIKTLLLNRGECDINRKEIPANVTLRVKTLKELVFYVKRVNSLL